MQKSTAYAKTESKSAVKTGQKVEADAEAQAKWGFLKNIINIHTFFDARGRDDRNKQASYAQKHSSNSTQTNSTAQHSDVQSHTAV